MDSRRGWSSLSSDLLIEIATRMPLIEDFTAIRGVCSSWRVAVTKNYFKPRTNLPLLMLPGKIPNKKDTNDDREFYSLSKRKVIMKLPLPETRLKRCLGVGFGWILTVALSGDSKLLNPFSRAQIELPNLKSPPCSGPHSLDEFGFISRAVLSADPSHTSDFVLLAIYAPLGLGFWKAGNAVWSKIEPFAISSTFADVAFHNGKFYAVDQNAKNIWVWDPFGSPNPNSNKAKVVFQVERAEKAIQVYMVESSNGELLLVTCHRPDYYNIFGEMRYYRIVSLDVVKSRGKQIYGLGNDAVFLGANASTSVAASVFPDFLKPNRIYIATDWSRNAIKMGVYNVADMSTEWLVDDEPLNRICSALWISPSS